MQEKITSCFLCGCNCGLIMTLDENKRIVKIRGDKDNLHSRGHICNKGLNQGLHYDSSAASSSMTESCWQNSAVVVGMP